MRIVLTGGGTGGHLIPFEPIIDGLRSTYQQQRKELPVWIDRGELEIYFLGVLDSESIDFFNKLDVKPISIPAAKLRRYPSPRTVSDLLFRLPIGLLKSSWYMWSIMPDVVVSKGGYGSIPVTLSAAWYRIPVLLHESDAVSGLANRLMAGIAAVMTVGFAATRHEGAVTKSKTIVTGTPVRKQLFRGGQEEAKRYFGFSNDDPVLLVMGGSQGARQINEALLEILPTLVEDMAVIHLAGKDNLADVKQAADELLSTSSRKDMYRPFGYLEDDIGQALIAADVVISRAGATSLAELAHLRKPSILIPLPGAAQDHQRINASVFDLAQALRVVSPENMGRALLLQNIRAVMFDEKIRDTLSSNIARFDHPQVARDISDLAFKLARGLQPVQPRHEDTSVSNVEKKSFSTDDQQASR